MCICMCMIYVYACVYSVCTSMYVWVHMCICMYLCVCMNVRICLHAHVCCVYKCACVYVYARVTVRASICSVWVCVHSPCSLQSTTVLVVTREWQQGEGERQGGEGRKRWWDVGLGCGRDGWGGSAAEATEAQAGMLPRQVANILLYLLYFILLL